jgi:hypothetical protein
MFDLSRWIEKSKLFALMRFPEEQREDVKDILDGKQIIIEHNVRYGKIICCFIPTPSDEIIMKDMRKQGGQEEPTVIYQCGEGTRKAHEKEVIKKIKAKVPSSEPIDDFVESQRIEGLTFYEPIGDLNTPYLFSEELKKSIPNFLNYLVEKLDIERISIHLDEHQTLDFVPPEMAQRMREMKKMLVEDFLAKHSNEQEVKKALRVKQGGARKRKGFVWTGKEKKAFYKKVESLPKKSDKSYWQYALDMLIEQEFDIETITWLKSRMVLKDASAELFKEAVKTWSKYLVHENWGKMEPEEKPRAFEYRHALNLLNYPDEFRFSTLDSYFYVGKKLSEKQNKPLKIRK